MDFPAYPAPDDGTEGSFGVILLSTFSASSKLRYLLYLTASLPPHPLKMF